MRADRRDGGQDGVDCVVGDGYSGGGVVAVLVVSNLKAERFEEWPENGFGNGCEVDVEDG